MASDGLRSWPPMSLPRPSRRCQTSTHATTTHPSTPPTHERTHHARARTHARSQAPTSRPTSASSARPRRAPSRRPSRRCARTRTSRGCRRADARTAPSQKRATVSEERGGKRCGVGCFGLRVLGLAPRLKSQHAPWHTANVAPSSLEPTAPKLPCIHPHRHRAPDAHQRAGRRRAGAPHARRPRRRAPGRRRGRRGAPGARGRAAVGKAAVAGPTRGGVGRGNAACVKPIGRWLLMADWWLDGSTAAANLTGAGTPQALRAGVAIINVCACEERAERVTESQREGETALCLGWRMWDGSKATHKYITTK